MAATDNSDYESKAILFHALSAAGQGDFAVANRLYRDRPSLSAAALAYLALAFVEMDRKATAGELLALLGQKNLDDAALKRRVPTGALPWSHSPAELRALYALALQRVTPKVAQGQGAGRLAPGPSRGPSLEPGQGDGPGGPGLVRVVQPEPLPGRALLA